MTRATRWIQRCALGIAVCATASCSFVLSFPEEGAGGAGGVGPGVCTPAPTVAWRGIPPSTDDLVLVSGLARAGDTTYAFGLSTSGVAGLNFPPGGTSQLFIAGIDDGGGDRAVLSIINCSDGQAANRPMPGRLTTRRAGDLIISASLAGGAGLDPAVWGFDPGANDGCTTMPQSIQSSGDSGFVPLFALVPDLPTGELIFANPPASADGHALDIDRRTPSGEPDGFVAGIGVASGPDIYGSSSVPSVFFLQRSRELAPNDETALLPGQFTNVDELPYAVAAGIAVDDQGTAWFGGGACPSEVGCAPQAFVGRWPLGAAAPEILADKPGVTSSIAAAAEDGGLVVFGGRYEGGTLDLLGAALPEPDASDPLVLAIDAATQAAAWSYPTADSTLDRAGWNAVSDVAIADEPDCGEVVWVVGCTLAAPGGDCKQPALGTRGFVLKLARSDGRELAVIDVTPATPATSMFAPTAIFSQGSATWMAATVLGDVELAGLALSAATPEAAVLKLHP